MPSTWVDNMAWDKLVGLFLWTHIIGQSQQSDMDGYKVLTVFADAPQDVNTIRHLKNAYSLDPWREVLTFNSSGDYLVSPDNLYDVIDTLNSLRLKHERLIEDVSGFLKNQTAMRNRNRRRRNSDTRGSFRYRFLPYDEIIKFLHYARDMANNVHLQVDSIGRSFEGRDTPYVKISRQPSQKKPILFIDAGIHGREWISPAMAVEMIHRLAFNQEQDPEVDNLLDKFDWIIVPVVNPDGYVHTFRHGKIGNRMWRKSRNYHYSKEAMCQGVDLNRNFGFAWNDDPMFGGSSNPCSGTYSGPNSFSEPETKNLRKLLLSNRDAILGYLSLHSFGQFFLYPWGFSSQVDLEDEKDLHRVATAFADTMRSRDYHYNIGGSAKTLYPAAGGSDDYVRGSVGVKYAYILELPPRGTSRFGFLLPEREVKGIVTDTWAGLSSFSHRLHHLSSANRSTTRYGYNMLR